MENKVYGRPSSLNEKIFTYCPGCGHGIVNRLLAEIVLDMGIIDDTIGVCYVGCGGMIYDFFNMDWAFPLHGRSPAVATGIKRTRPDKVVIGYQGDGDLAAIGTAEIIHAATRGENLTVIFVNNGIYGMTGGQMAPTTLIGQKSATCVDGREAEYHGRPIRICEMLSQLDGVCYAERVTIDTPAHINATKKAIMKGVQNQIDCKGFSIIEVISPCPVQWGLSPNDAYKRIADEVLPFYNLKVFKDVDKEAV
ncbi:MAG: thiamine pyrophosphate-dependent enzyme [Lachnospiraceae bacterium]|nr:thiamine pyrophosphate-dependent enzyme [Lachnospiraceae bacterium]